jgi:hypothetical protein
MRLSSLMRLSSASLAASRVLRSAARDVRSLRSRSSLPLISSFSYSSCSLPSTVSCATSARICAHLPHALKLRLLGSFTSGEVGSTRCEIAALAF